MLYWPTERGAPNVLKDLAPHPTEHQPSSEERLARVLRDAEQCLADNLWLLHRRYRQQVHDLYEQHRTAAWAAFELAQEAQDEQTPVQ